MTELQYPAEGIVEYQAVLLDEEHHNSDSGSVSGILLDGVTVRIDDLRFVDPDCDGDTYEMCVDYKFIDGIPENIKEFEARLSNVMLQVMISSNDEDDL